MFEVKDNVKHAYLYFSDKIYFSCYGSKPAQRAKAEDLRVDNTNYDNLINQVSNIHRNMSGGLIKKEDLTELESIIYFMAHRAYFLFKKKYEITNNNELQDMFNLLTRDNRVLGVTSELDIIQVATGILSKENDSIINEDVRFNVEYFSNISSYYFRGDYDIAFINRSIKYDVGYLDSVPGFIEKTREIHSAMGDFSDILSKVCKIESVEKDEELFKRAFDLSSKMKCFLVENKELDDNCHSAAKEIVKKHSESEIVSVEKSDVLEVIKFLEEESSHEGRSEDHREKCRGMKRRLEDSITLSKNLEVDSVSETIQENKGMEESASKKAKLDEVSESISHHY